MFHLVMIFFVKFLFVSAYRNKSDATDKRFFFSVPVSAVEQVWLRHASLQNLRLNLRDVSLEKFLSIQPFLPVCTKSRT
jgi:hypothetical protein